jgi:hyperosmotically inducible protein
MKFRKHFSIAAFAAVISLSSVGAAYAFGFLDIITAPKTLFDRAIEARSMEDIVVDNKIVIEVNAIMAKFGTIKASTEIYEQRLLITGLFDDKKLYDKFYAEVKKLDDIKELYWHIRYMSEAEQDKRDKAGTMIGWADALLLDTKVGLALVGEMAVADVNYRVAADGFSHVYIIGRARSKEELKKALAAARGVETVKKIVNYVVVRP